MIFLSIPCKPFYKILAKFLKESLAELISKYLKASFFFFE